MKVKSRNKRICMSIGSKAYYLLSVCLTLGPDHCCVCKCVTTGFKWDGSGKGQVPFVVFSNILGRDVPT